MVAIVRYITKKLGIAMEYRVQVEKRRFHEKYLFNPKCVFLDFSLKLFGNEVYIFQGYFKHILDSYSNICLFIHTLKSMFKIVFIVANFLLNN